MKLIVPSSIVTVGGLLATVASAGEESAATRQRVVIVSTDTQYAFKLLPVGRGPLRRDSGTITWGDARQHFMRRDGQLVEVDDVRATFTGQRGTFELQSRVEWTNPGHGYSIGTNRWTLVSGTGPYSPARGSTGRGSSIWPPHSFPFFRFEGVVR